MLGLDVCGGYCGCEIWIFVCVFIENELGEFGTGDRATGCEPNSEAGVAHNGGCGEENDIGNAWATSV